MAVAGVGALALLNALFVAGEFGLIGSRRSRLEAMARAGNPGARRVLGTVTSFPRLDRAIATIQVGITCASLGLGMYGEHAVAGLLRPLFAGLGETAWLVRHGAASVVAVLILTLVHMVIGEMVPKTLALQDPVRAALWTERPVRWTGLALRPLVIMLALFSRGLTRLLRIEPAAAGTTALTLDEIQWVIGESGAVGALEEEQAQLLADLVDFEDLPVRKAMLPRSQIVGIPLEANRDEVRALLETSRHSRYPVFRVSLDDMVGYVHVKDLVHPLDEEGAFHLMEICRQLPCIPESASCARLLEEFRARRTHIALVVDEHGGTAGMVTMDDLMEEIVGDVQDEFDAEEAPLRTVGDGAAMAVGTLRLDDLEEVLHLGFKDDEVDTIAGLILKELGRMARPGDAVVLAGVTLTVEKVDRLAITRVRLDWDPASQSPAGAAGD
jgi:CBS domain containing-hemolysin-like protein